MHVTLFWEWSRQVEASEICRKNAPNSKTNWLKDQKGRIIQYWGQRSWIYIYPYIWIAKFTTPFQYTSLTVVNFEPVWFDLHLKSFSLMLKKQIKFYLGWGTDWIFLCFFLLFSQSLLFLLLCLLCSASLVNETGSYKEDSWQTELNMVVVRPVICVTNKKKRHFVFIYGGWRVEREHSWNSLQIFEI